MHAAILAKPSVEQSDYFDILLSHLVAIDPCDMFSTKLKVITIRSGLTQVR